MIKVGLVFSISNCFTVNFFFMQINGWGFSCSTSSLQSTKYEKKCQNEHHFIFYNFYNTNMFYGLLTFLAFITNFELCSQPWMLNVFQPFLEDAFNYRPFHWISDHNFNLTHETLCMVPRCSKTCMGSDIWLASLFLNDTYSFLCK